MTSQSEIKQSKILTKSNKNKNGAIIVKLNQTEINLEEND